MKHGKTLADLRSNSELNGLIGGFQQVILSADEAMQRGSSKKTVSQRAGKPIFDM